MTPTSRTLQEGLRRGWVGGVVEKYNQYARKRFDFLGIIDVIFCTPDGIVGIQTTSGDNHAHRREKAIKEHKLAHWKIAGGKFAIWSWSKKVHYNKDGSKSKVKNWELREESL